MLLCFVLNRSGNHVLSEKNSHRLVKYVAYYPIVSMWLLVQQQQPKQRESIHVQVFGQKLGMRNPVVMYQSSNKENIKYFVYWNEGTDAEVMAPIANEVNTTCLAIHSKSHYPLQNVQSLW